jgi:hypothetical protein
MLCTISHIQGGAHTRTHKCIHAQTQGVVGAATGAGIIIGAYFAFYSTAKQCLRKTTNMSEGACHSHSHSQIHTLTYTLTYTLTHTHCMIMGVLCWTLS